MNTKHARLLASIALAAFLSWLPAAPALAQVAPDLGTAAGYVVLGTNSIPVLGTVTCTDTGPGTAINGDVGTTFSGSPGITNTACTINGVIDFPVAASVVTDFNAAYAVLNTANVCEHVIPIASDTLEPGVYCSEFGTTIGAGVTLTLNGSASDVWVFKVGTTGGALTLNSANVVMTGGADACNVYWWSQAATTLTSSNFVGTVLSGAAITMTNGSWLGRAMATTDVAITDAAPLTFAGCAPPAEITVNKNFVPDNLASVSVSLTCDSGTVTSSPLSASEGSPAVFTVGAADLGATCDATETVVPPGHTANQTNCQNVPLNGSCTIINTLLNATTFTVNKDFLPNSPAPVSVSLSCTGAVVPTPLTANASEGSPAVFTLTGAVGGETCTATETVPVGYTADQTLCSTVPVSLNGDATCTITNRLADNAITVYKDFFPNSLATVSVALTCTSGTVTSTPLNATEGSPAVFTVPTGNGPCTATEIVPLGYTAIQLDCVDVPLGGTCTIFNTRIPPINVPVLSGRAMIMLAALLALLGLAAVRRLGA